MQGHHVVRRDMFGGNLSIVANYVVDPHMYNDKFFRGRFRMPNTLFLCIVVGGGEDRDDYFRQRANAIVPLEPLHFRRWLDHSKSLHMMFQLI